MKIRRNKDGQQHMGDLRRELDARTDVTIHWVGGSWVLSTKGPDFWHESTLPYFFDERMAIQKALWGDYECPEEARFHATRSA